MTVGSVVNAIAILRHLAGANEPQGVNAIARSLNLSPSSCFNILKTLHEEDFVDFDPISKAYRLGSGPARLVGPGSGALPIHQIADQLQPLADEFSVAAGLWRLSRSGRLMLVDVALSESGTRLHLTVGQRVPMYLGALGRCMAAHQQLTSTPLAKALKSARWERQPTLEQFVAEIEKTRRRGWAVDEGMAIKGITTVAATIASDVSVNYGVTASMFEGQHETKTVERIGQKISDLARRFAVGPL